MTLSTGPVTWSPRAKGNYRFLGRRDHQIKSRGYRIELGEIETAINAHPDGHRVRRHGGARRCHLEPNRGLRRRQTPTSTDDKLAAWCATLIPKYMVPESFVFADLLPKTSTGKIDRQALQKTG